MDINQSAYFLSFSFSLSLFFFFFLSRFEYITVNARAHIQLFASFDEVYENNNVTSIIDFIAKEWIKIDSQVVMYFSRYQLVE
jgi:hypothetical protein